MKPLSLGDFRHRADRIGFLASENQLCWYCNKNVATTRDHFYPLSRGLYGVKRKAHRFRKRNLGLEGENLIPCCQPCNSIKGARLITEWALKLIEPCRHVLVIPRQDNFRNARLRCLKCNYSAWLVFSGPEQRTNSTKYQIRIRHAQAPR